MELQYSTRDLARAAVIAAAYAALAWISNFFGLAFPAIQFRLSEALCVLPCRDRKAAIPGLAVGCLITNLLSPYGLLDLVVGTLATLLAAVWSGRCRSAWTAAVPPVVCNAVIVGAMLAWESTGFSAAFAGLFAYNALTVGIGEAAVCFLLGVPLLRALEKLGCTDRRQAVIVGDSLTSDLAAAKNARVDGVWYNPRRMDWPEGYENPYLKAEVKQLHDLLRYAPKGTENKDDRLHHRRKNHG